MRLRELQFNCEIADVIKEMKAQLAINGVQLFSKYFDSGDDLMVCCPYHKDGQERRPSAGIRKSDGMFHCLACDKTVALDEMIANCFGYSDPMWGYRWLVQNFAVTAVEERKSIVLDMSRDKKVDYTPSYVPETELDSYRYYHPYMRKRGLTDEIVELFDIGYDKETDSITFPVKDIDGRCLFVARRKVSYKRFDLPKNLEKPLYGSYEIWKYAQENLVVGGRGRHYPISEIYVCEGVFDCLRLWCNGKFAVAGFGCLFSSYQVALLNGLPTRKLVLALDSDKAGRDATNKLRKSVKGKLLTEVILPEGRKDIGECTDEEIQNLQEVW